MLFCVFLQVRQLVLDPAVQHEFERLRRELEEHKTMIQQLKEQNDSLTFTAVSARNKNWYFYDSACSLLKLDCCILP